VAILSGMNDNIAPVEFTRKYEQLTTEYCEPLFANTSICYFSHIQYFTNCTGIAFSTNYKAVQFFWERGEYLRQQDIEEMPDYYLLDKNDSVRNEVICKLIGIEHMVLCVFKYADHYEVNSFGSNVPISQLFEFYMNNTELLIMFSNYFRDSTAALIEQAKQTPYPLKDFNKGFVARKTYLPPPQELEYKFQAERLIAKYRLSPRELQCLKLAAHSKSVKEIAKDIGLSPNTVKFYIKNLKNKINCSKIAEAVKIFYENSLTHH